jgi:hypothetical protein
MREKYQDESELRKVKNGLIGAITVAHLKQEIKPPKEQKQYESTARKFLNYLVDTESLIHKIFPYVLEENEDTIQKAREKFPEPESLDYLQKLLEMYP